MPARSPALALSPLAAVLLTLACRPPPPPPPPEPAPTPNVIEWFLGEQVRRSNPSAHGISLGILTLDLTADPPTPGPPHPNSCAPDLVSFIRAPADTGVLFGTNDAGELLRYAGEGWFPVGSNLEVPPVRKLLAFTAATSPLEMLVTTKEDNHERIALLVIAHDELTAVLPPDPVALVDREHALQRFDSGRCLHDNLDCLHLTAVDDELLLMSEPTLYANWIQRASLTNGTVHDVRYADADGKAVDLLSTEACPTPVEPSPPLEPEAPQ